MVDIVTAEFIAWAKAYDGKKFHAVLCDPPYGLEFMSVEFDTFRYQWKEFPDLPVEWVDEYKKGNS